MYSLSAKLPHVDRSMFPGLALDGVWFAGVSLGLWAARFYGGSVRALALAAGSAVLSVSGACTAAVLPLFLSAFAVFLFHRFGAYLACGVRGIFVGFLLGCLVGAGGLWLGALLLFSGLMGSPVLLWFLSRRLKLDQRFFFRDCLWAFCALMAVAAVDLWVIVPFLRRALSF